MLRIPVLYNIYKHDQGVAPVKSESCDVVSPPPFTLPLPVKLYEAYILTKLYKPSA